MWTTLLRVHSRETLALVSFIKSKTWEYKLFRKCKELTSEGPLSFATATNNIVVWDRTAHCIHRIRIRAWLYSYECWSTIHYNAAERTPKISIGGWNWIIPSLAGTSRYATKLLVSTSEHKSYCARSVVLLSEAPVHFWRELARSSHPRPDR